MEEIKKRFVNPNDQLKMVIVRDMRYVYFEMLYVNDLGGCS
jgi:hypothetical protein